MPREDTVDLKTVLRDNPKFHEMKGQLISGWRLDDGTLHFLDQFLRPGMKTCETGAGISTVLFALKGCQHTCIVPNGPLVDRIKAYCESRDINLSTMTFILGTSERILPGLQGSDYDLALIDGRHGFPTPFIDWFYMSQLLKIGGVVIVDDMHIWTCDMLRRFLASETEDWQSLSETNRAAIFRKRDDAAFHREWSSQPFVRQRSSAESRLARASQAIDHLAHKKGHLVPWLLTPRLTARVMKLWYRVTWRFSRRQGNRQTVNE